MIDWKFENELKKNNITRDDAQPYVLQNVKMKFMDEYPDRLGVCKGLTDLEEGCFEVIDLKSLTSVEADQFNKTGLCPVCYQKLMSAKRADIAKRKEEKKQKKIAWEQWKAEHPSAFKQVYDLLVAVSDNINDEQLEKLMDINITKPIVKNPYQLVIEINDMADWKEVTFFGGKSRYSKKSTLTICSKTLYLTNNWYKNTIPNVPKLLEELGIETPIDMKTIGE